MARCEGHWRLEARTPAATALATRSVWHWEARYIVSAIYCSLCELMHILMYLDAALSGAKKWYSAD